MNQYRLPVGLKDYYGSRLDTKEQLRHYLFQRFDQLGYHKIQTPLLEYEPVFAEYETESRDLYRVLEADGNVLTIRPDLTLPIARFLSTTNVALPNKFSYVGEFMQRHREYQGSEREQTQAGIELVGYPSTKAEFECLTIINQINQDWFDNSLVIELGSVDLAEAVLDQVTKDHDQRRSIKQALFQKNLPVYEKLIEPYSSGPIGTFLKEWPWLFGSSAEIEELFKDSGLPAPVKKIIQQIITFAQFITNLPGQSVMIDLASKAPQKYYTGLIFKAYTAQSNQYVISGGRYDQLLANVNSKNIPAVGMGINIQMMADLISPATPASRVEIYCQQDQLFAAQQLVNQHVNYELSLADSLREARSLAHQHQRQLMILNEKGELINDLENRTN